MPVSARKALLAETIDEGLAFTCAQTRAKLFNGSSGPQIPTSYGELDMINQGEGVLQKRVFDLPIGPGSPISGREKGVSKPNRFAQRIMGIKPRRAYNLTQGPVTKGEAAQIIVQSCLKKR